MSPTLFKALIKRQKTKRQRRKKRKPRKTDRVYENGYEKYLICKAWSVSDMITRSCLRSHIIGHTPLTMNRNHRLAIVRVIPPLTLRAVVLGCSPHASDQRERNERNGAGATKRWNGKFPLQALMNENRMVRE